MDRVIIVQEHLPHYRAGFYDLLRTVLKAEDIQLDLTYDPRTAGNLLDGHLSWATPIPIRWIRGAGWQPIWPFIQGSDLVIVQQEAKYLSTYALLAQRIFGGPKVAFWGHGRNFQARNSDSASERLKRFVSRHCDWWFAYNELSARVVRDLGFPADRITSVQNAVDVSAMAKARDGLTVASRQKAREEIGLRGGNVAVFAGGLYDDKRLPFLVDACDQIRRRVPDFELIVIGKGPRGDVITEAARTRSWIFPVGAKSDLEKLPYWCHAKVLLMPGLVGLVVLDSFALGTPMVTTAFPYHSPEIDYLKDGENGVIVAEWENCTSYADAVIGLLEDEPRRLRLVDEGRKLVGTYTIEDMARNFADGIVHCLRASA